MLDEMTSDLLKTTDRKLRVMTHTVVTIQHGLAGLETRPTMINKTRRSDLSQKHTATITTGTRRGHVLLFTVTFRSNIL